MAAGQRITQQRIPSKLQKPQFLVPLVFAVIGVIFIFTSFASPVPLTIDETLPVPQNVQAFAGDQEITVTWDPVNQTDTIIGYYITYRQAGSNDEYQVRQQQVRDNGYFEEPTAIQLQPLLNDVEYEINVQSASGQFERYPNGDLINSGSGDSNWARADGKVSNQATVTMAPSSARVDDMRQRLTRFFDDFNLPPGPFDELLWNTATTSCIREGTAAAFINNQFHSHNQIRSSCDRAGMASRPRVSLDLSQASEANPVVLEFDLDGSTQPRDTWYLDFIPLDRRPLTGHPVDITSHNDLFDSDSEDPGNMLRIKASGGIGVSYYDVFRNPSSLPIDAEDSACDIAQGDGSTGVDFRWHCWGAEKSPGVSVLPQPDLFKPIPNVRLQWRIEFTDRLMRLYISGVHVFSTNLPTDFLASQEYTIHSTIFSYNTGKQKTGVAPYVQLIHWDNFGFSGPPAEEVIHNYQEGGATGDDPAFSTTTASGGELPPEERTTIIPIPDQIGNLRDGKARLFFTMQDFSAGSYDPYAWDPSHKITVNGTEYPFYDPATNMVNPKIPVPFGELVAGYVPLAMTVNIDQSDLVTGDNVITFNIGRTGVLNVHLELPYDTSNPDIPNYTQPLEIFGDAWLNITRPPITTCDSYWFIERDLGLPYQNGKLNVEPGPCTLIESHQTGDPPPPSDVPDSVWFQAEEGQTTRPPLQDAEASGGQYIEFGQ